MLKKSKLLNFLSNLYITYLLFCNFFKKYLCSGLEIKILTFNTDWKIFIIALRRLLWQKNKPTNGLIWNSCVMMFFPKSPFWWRVESINSSWNHSIKGKGVHLFYLFPISLNIMWHKKLRGTCHYNFAHISASTPFSFIRTNNNKYKQHLWTRKNENYGIP